MQKKKLESLLQEVKQLKENLQNIEQSVTLINSILLQQQLEEDSKKIEKLNHQQLEDGASYKCSNCPPIETPVEESNDYSDYAPTERYDYYEQHDREWLAYHERGGKW